MNTFYQKHRTSRGQAGAALPLVAIVVVILIVLAIGAYFLIVRPNRGAGIATPRASLAAASTVSAPAAPPADVASMSTAQLLDEARNAVRAQRWVAPAGNNAFEFYLKVLEKDPNNQVATTALRESFTTGANAAEQSINAGNFDEAQREITLLAQADSGNYTLTILRSKLDAQRKLDARAEEQQKQAEALAAKQAAAAAAAAAAPPPPEQDAAAEQAAADQLAQAQAVPVAPPPPPPKPKPKPQPVGPTRGALLVKTSPAIPPRVAVRRHRSGWVDVIFTVTAQGTVTNASVVDSKPGHIFDRAALAAVAKYQFKPALVNGVPVTTRATQRINFNL